jgi:hypothetical protein
MRLRIGGTQMLLSPGTLTAASSSSRHADAPLRARLELDRRLEHLHRCRVGRRVGATGLAEDPCHFGNGLDHPVRLLQQLCRLRGRQAGKGGWHVEQIPFVEGRHELAPELQDGNGGQGEDDGRDSEGELREPKHGFERRPVDTHEKSVQRIRGLARNPAADQVAHEHRNERDGQPRGCRHRIGLGERQRREQATFLGLEREHRNERQRDHDQREEEGRPHFYGGIADQRPALAAARSPALLRLESLEMLVHVLDHDDRRIHHRADGDGDPAERHDVGVDTLPAHDDERDEDADGQRHDGDQRRAQVEQEDGADQRDDEELLQEL